MAAKDLDELRETIFNQNTYLLDEPEVKELIASIKVDYRSIDQIKEAVVKKPDTTAKDLRAGTYTRGDDEYRKGYNQAIADIKKALNIEGEE